MKIDVEANDFCPDNCKNCEIISHTAVSTYGKRITERYCKYKNICNTLYENLNKSEMTEND